MFSTLPGYHRAFPGPLSTQGRTQRPHYPLLGGSTMSSLHYGRRREGAVAQNPMPHQLTATYGASFLEADLTTRSDPSILSYGKRQGYPQSRKPIHTPLLGGATISGLSYSRGEGYQQPRKQAPIGTRPRPQQAKTNHAGTALGREGQESFQHPALGSTYRKYASNGGYSQHPHTIALSLDSNASVGPPQHNCACPSCLLKSLYAAESSIDNRAMYDAKYNSRNSMNSPPNYHSRAAPADSPFNPETMAQKLLEDSLEDDMLFLFKCRMVVVEIEPKNPRPTSVTKATVRKLEAQAEKEVRKQEREIAMNDLAKSLQGFRFGNPPLQEDDYDEDFEEMKVHQGNPFAGDFRYDDLYARC